MSVIHTDDVSDCIKKFFEAVEKEKLNQKMRISSINKIMEIHNAKKVSVEKEIQTMGKKIVKTDELIERAMKRISL